MLMLLHMCFDRHLTEGHNRPVDFREILEYFANNNIDLEGFNLVIKGFENLTFINSN